MIRQRSIAAAVVLGGIFVGMVKGVDIYVIEDSGFFGPPGPSQGDIGRFPANDPSSVTVVGNTVDLLNMGGLDFRPGENDRLHAFEVTTNSLRTLGLTGGNTLIDSLGFCDTGVAGLTFSNDGSIAYAVGNASASRIIEADAETGAVLEVHTIFGISISALATAPPCVQAPAVPGEIWAVNNTGSGAQLVTIDLDTSTVNPLGFITGIGFIQAFEVGLDWSLDGTLYVSFNGVEQIGGDFFDVSTHFYTLDPATRQATLVGVIQADDTWDAASITVDDQLPGDIDGDGAKDINDLSVFINVLLGTETDCLRVFRSDVNRDSKTDGDDIQSFVMELIP